MRIGKLVDAHCHYDLFPNPQRILREAEREEIHSIAVTNTPSVFGVMARLAWPYEYIRPAIGLHPELAVERASELPIFERKVYETECVGEVGLDYRVIVKPAERMKQRRVFEKILEGCGKAGGRIVSVHSRRAEADVVAAIRDCNPGPVIFHWYSGSLKTLSAAIALGAYFSVNPAMLRSQRGRRLIEEVPADRLLTESDGPFVRIDGEAARPSCARVVLDGIASLQGTVPEEVGAQVLANWEEMWRGYRRHGPTRKCRIEDDSAGRLLRQ